MKITAKTLMLSIEHEVSLGKNDVIEATLLHQAFVFENKDGSIGIDLDFSDIQKVKFMGIPIKEGYDEYKKFKSQLMGLGIDVEALMDEAASKIITDDDVEELKSLFKKTVKSTR